MKIRKMNAQDIQIKSVLLYGKSGSGKTYQASTLDGKILYVKSEQGSGTLASAFDAPPDHIDVVDCQTLGELAEVVAHVEGNPTDYDFVFVDSLTDIAQKTLAILLDQERHGQKAYGALGDQITKTLWRALAIKGPFWVMLAHAEPSEPDSSGVVMQVPSFPGRKLSAKIPHEFDAVLVAQASEDAYRFLCRSDGNWVAKNRIGRLDQHEPAHLGNAIKKMQGNK